MHPLSIIAAFAFLGALSMIGALMMVMGSRRLLKLVGNPTLSWQHLREHGARVMVPVNAFLITLGLILMALGVRGIYRIIWAS